MERLMLEESHIPLYLSFYIVICIQLFECTIKILEGKKGVVNSDGELWRDQRRFALHVFRNFGLGKNLMQERVIFKVNRIYKMRQNKNNGVILCGEHESDARF
jgi:hypothetical protein